MRRFKKYDNVMENFISRIILLIVFGGAVLVGTPSMGAIGDLLQRYDAPWSENSWGFGNYIAANEGSVMIGTPHRNEQAGALYIYDKLSGNLDHPGSDYSIGRKIVGIGNDFLVATSIRTDAYGNIDGRPINTYWEKTQTMKEVFPVPLEARNVNFGDELAVSGDQVLISAVRSIRNQDPRLRVNTVYLYDYPFYNPVQVFTTPTYGTQDDFGNAIALNEQYVLISDESINGDLGLAYLYDKNNGDMLHTFAQPEDESCIRRCSYGGYFGRSVALIDDYVLVGETGLTNIRQYDDLGDFIGTEEYYGAVNIFDAVTGELVRTVKNPSDTFERFGANIVTMGNYFAVNGDDTYPGADGSVFLFDVTTGELVHTFVDPYIDVASNREFGDHMATDGEYLYLSGVAHLLDPVSGEYYEQATVYQYQVIPEPGTVGLIMLSGIIVCLRSRRG